MGDSKNIEFVKRVNKFVMIVTIIIDICTVAGYAAAFATI